MNKKLSNIKLKAMFWNSRSIVQRQTELHKMLQGIDIFICVESWLKPNYRFQFAGFNTFRKDRLTSRGGGIVFLVKKNLAFKEITSCTIQNDKIEITGIRLLNTSPSIDIVACYRIPGLTLSQTEWFDIANSIDCNQTHAILIGDFNAHNIKWNCETTDKNGERFDYCIDAKDLFLHNDNSSTHLDISTGKKSNIDLVLSSLPLADKMDVAVSDETFGSDHFPIIFNIDTKRHLYEKKTFKLKSVRTNWSDFQNIYLKNSIAISLPMNITIFLRPVNMNIL